MRKILAFIIGGVLLLASCAKEPIEVEPEVIENWEGNWECSENSNLYGVTLYNVVIKYTDANKTKVEMTNFYNSGSDESIIGNISNNKITINTQSFCESEGERIIHGQGNVLSTDVIKWDYFVDDGTVTDTVSATFERVLVQS